MNTLSLKARANRTGANFSLVFILKDRTNLIRGTISLVESNNPSLKGL